MLGISQGRVSVSATCRAALYMLLDACLVCAGMNMRMPMLQPNSAVPFPESVNGSVGGFADGEAGIGRRVASSVNLGSRAASVDLEATPQVRLSRCRRPLVGFVLFR